MRKTMTLAVAAATMFVGAHAVADLHDPTLDETYLLGDFNLNSAPNGGVISVSFTIVPPANEFPIVGFSFLGTVEGITDSSTWASDLLLVIEDPLGGSTSFGGFSTDSDFDWDFQGSGSNDDGTYSSGPHLIWADTPIEKDGSNTFVLTFTNDWDSTLAAQMFWSDVEITFHKIPSPGTLALIGIAGLIGSRRRRA